MFTRYLPVALTLFCPPVAAQECVNTGGPDSCARVLACIGEDGLWFDGRSVGWNSGTVAGTLSDGTICTGEWGYTSANIAETYATCDDGTEVYVIAVAQDGLTGTTTGEGTTSDGRAVTVWTGNNVLKFLRGDSGEPELPCAPAPIPIS